MWYDTPAANLNHRVTGGSTVHSIKQEIRATGPVSPEIPTSVFVISLHLATNRDQKCAANILLIVSVLLRSASTHTMAAAQEGEVLLTTTSLVSLSFTAVLFVVAWWITSALSRAFPFRRPTTDYYIMLWIVWDVLVHFTIVSPVPPCGAVWWVVCGVVGGVFTGISKRSDSLW